MGWFGKKKQEPAAQQQQAEEYGGAEKTVAIDLNSINRSTFKPVVGWVVVLSGELRGRDFRLVDGKNTMGTAADCDVVLTDPYLSSKHAVIRHENGTFTLSDLDSTNGTFVNERRVSRYDIIDNDKVRLGRTELKFKSLE
jgi:pSer/pThr/pTyr-binding forkhead associated (FHA) protein